MRPDHPKQGFCFFVEGEFDREISEKLDLLIENLAAAKTWTIGPPIPTYDPASADVSGSHEPMTTGGMLELYSAWPPWNQFLPRDVDIAQFHECEALIEALCPFSREHNLEIAFQLDQTQVGWIENGKVDRLLTQGLLTEWRKALGI